MVKVSALPPTAESFVENVKRTHLQACIWKNALDADPPDLSPETYGWLRNEVVQTLVQVTVPKGVALAPDDVLKRIKCGCESDDPCLSMRCGCRQAGLGCTMFCGCQGSACRNEQTVVA